MIEAVQAENLSCRRGGRIVLNSLNFEVRRGGILLLRGPNGAGKTTLLRTVAGFIRPEAGALRFVTREGAGLAAGEAQEQMHFVGHLSAVKPRLTVLENVSFWQKFYGAAGGVEEAEDALEAFGMLDLADVPAGHLSAGQTRRLGLARLIAAPRPLWLLDEPSSSLDAASTVRLEQVIRRHLDGGGIAIAATHTDLAIPGAATLALAPPSAVSPHVAA